MRSLLVLALAVMTLIGLAMAQNDGAVEEDFHMRPGVDEQHVRLVSVTPPTLLFLFTLLPLVCSRGSDL
jgi:hypothetical protein